MRRLLVPLLSLPLLLAACGQRDEGTSISIKDEGGNTIASADGDSGEVKLDLPGFSGNIKLPKIKLDASNFELNGVHLYPGSTIDSFGLKAGEGKGDGGIRVAFTSPASAGTVRDWLSERLKKADFQVRADGNGLTGTTNEKKPFALTLTPSEGEKTRGVIVIG